MRRFLLILCLINSLYLFSQVKDDFSDRNFTDNPEWGGTLLHFTVNDSLQLQANAPGASVSYLSTLSEAIKNAEWQCSLKITCNPSANDYACFYVTSEYANLTNTNGYYVQVGNTEGAVSLYRQTGKTKTKIIEGTPGKVNTNIIKVKVTRDSLGNWQLYSKRTDETDFVLEGTARDTTYQTSYFAGVLFSNTATTGSDFYFDDIKITGDKYMDTKPPVLRSIRTLGHNRLAVTFSEFIAFAGADFFVSKGVGSPIASTVSEDGLTDTLTFASDFALKTVYTFSANNVFDLNGNVLTQKDYEFSLTDESWRDDLIRNEKK
jgi:hypothetical protein